MLMDDPRRESIKKKPVHEYYSRGPRPAAVPGSGPTWDAVRLTVRGPNPRTIACFRAVVNCPPISGPSFGFRLFAGAKNLRASARSPLGRPEGPEPPDGGTHRPLRIPALPAIPEPLLIFKSKCPLKVEISQGLGPFFQIEPSKTDRKGSESCTLPKRTTFWCGSSNHQAATVQMGI